MGDNKPPVENDGILILMGDCILVQSLHRYIVTMMMVPMGMLILIFHPCRFLTPVGVELIIRFFASSSFELVHYDAMELCLLLWCLLLAEG